jgi:prolipoprotein diacylglyceryltransferase
VGSVTSVCWAVKFPDAEGFRHPVVLYDGLKNLLIIPILWYASRWRPPTGRQLSRAMAGSFLTSRRMPCSSGTHDRHTWWHRGSS